jgi:beta-glucosidase-like glycosyl hydrolase
MINSTYACENPALLNGLLKTEMGFRGYVQSDWQATMSTLAAAEGLDMSMPGDVSPLLSLRSAGFTSLCLCLDVPFHLHFA